MKTQLLLVVIALLAGGRGIAAQEARFTEVSGTVEFKNTGETRWQPAAVGSMIAKDTVISTGIKSSAVITVGASTVTVSPLTMLTLEELARRDSTEETAIYLRTGRIQADVTPPSGMRSDLTVRSPITTASVRGTSFSYTGQRLSVQSGQVSLSNRSGQTVFISKDQISYAGSGRDNRLETAFSAAAAAMRPIVSGMENIGLRQGRSQRRESSQVSITLDWN